MRILPVVLALFVAPSLLAAPSLTGQWDAQTSGGAPRALSLYLTASGETLSGYMANRDGYLPIANGKIDGDSFSFDIVRDDFGVERRSTYKGKVEGQTLSLQFPSRDDRPGRQVQMTQVSASTPAAMPPPPKKISLPPASPVPYNGLAKTPPMGWNSWNKFASKVSDQLVRETADAIVSSGMKNAGYIYVNIDDTWQGSRDANGNIQANSKFPDMKALTAYVHSKGLKIGIYSSPGPKTCANYEGSFGHEEQDAKTYADWGFDFLKYDWCSASRVYDYHSMPAVYAKMGRALKATGRPIVYSLCQYGVFNGPQWGAKVDGNSWRTTGDISDNWKSMSHIGFDLQLDLYKYSGPGHWNDPDMLEIGNGGMTETEYRTHMSLWSLLAAPLLAGNDLQSMSPATKSILLNKEVIAIDQDKLGKQAQRVSKDGDLEVWARPLAGGGEAVGIFNRGAQAATVKADESALNLHGDYAVRDLWAHADKGKFGDNYSAQVPSHSVVLLKLTPAR